MRIDQAITDKDKAAVAITEAVVSRKSSGLFFKDLISNPVVHLLVLIAIVFYCYSRTLGSYFLADDFGEICYVHKIFQGDFALFWSNFTGNYMQVPGMSVYRPFLLTSLMLDYALWGANAFGYYLSNILYFIGDCVFLYCIVSSLTASWTRARSRAAAFFSAALFAAYPLHCESISWVVGRVDIACCFYYLAAIYCFIRSRLSANRLWLPACMAGFCVALLTKEMAIGLPVVVSAIAFLFLSSGGAPARLKSAIKASTPLWLLTLCYFPFRYLVLGTFTGGYTGGIGASQLGNIVTKWTDLDTLRRIFFPLNYSVFQDGGIYAHILSGAYAIVIAGVGIRLLARSVPWSWVMFCAVWLVTAAAPIYQLWGLGYNLEGSRFFFFMTVPLSVILSVMVFAPVGENADATHEFSNRLTLVNSAALLLLVALFARVSYLNNVPWVHAGKTVREVQRKSEELAKRLSNPDERIIVLGIPKDHGGAHMILNGATYAMMLAEPFVRQNCAGRFLTFDPALFGNPELINASRLKNYLTEEPSRPLFFWNDARGTFTQINLRGDSRPIIPSIPAYSPAERQDPTPAQLWQASTASGATFKYVGPLIQIENVGNGDGITLSGLNLNPSRVDFIVLRLKHLRVTGSPSISTSWKGALCDGHTEEIAITPRGDEASATVYVPLSSHWRWYAAGTIRQVRVALHGLQDVEINSAELIDSSPIMPSLSISGAKESLRGVYEHISGVEQLSYRGSSVVGACNTQIEITKPNFFFEHYANEDEKKAVMTRLPAGALDGTTTLSRRLFPEHSYYQVRARCTDKDGQPVGCPSDPVTIRL